MFNFLLQNAYADRGKTLEWQSNIIYTAGFIQNNHFENIFPVLFFV